MKRISALLLTLAMVLTLTACGGKEGAQDQTTDGKSAHKIALMPLPLFWTTGEMSWQFTPCGPRRTAAHPAVWMD